MQNIIWGNKYILVKSQLERKEITLYSESWIQSGFIYMKDLLLGQCAEAVTMTVVMIIWYTKRWGVGSKRV